MVLSSFAAIKYPGEKDSFSELQKHYFKTAKGREKKMKVKIKYISKIEKKDFNYLKQW